MAKRYPANFVNPLIRLKRNGKQYTNIKTWVDEQKRIRSINGIKPQEISRDTYFKGNRTELNLSEKDLLHIQILREHGLRLPLKDEDFKEDDKR